jgi:hypothetical protein
MTTTFMIAAANQYVVAAFGLGGTLIGALVGGRATYAVAKKTSKTTIEVAKKTSDTTIEVAENTRQAAEAAWVRDTRRQFYDRFLTEAQKLLIACERCNGMSDDATSVTKKADCKKEVETSHSRFFEAYGTVQTVAQLPVVEAARTYAYRLWELKEELDGLGVLDAENFKTVAELVRDARHDTIDAMRGDLDLHGRSAKPPDDYNPFAGTGLGKEYPPGARPGSKRAAPASTPD